MKQKKLKGKHTFSVFRTTCQVLLILTLLFQRLNLYAQTPPEQYALGVQPLSISQYNSLPNVNWDTLVAYSITTDKFLVCSPISGGRIVLLNTPPIGDQGEQGSCVGWATGYAASSILAYPKYSTWNTAKRSPSFVFNQIKVSQDCRMGSYMTDAFSLLTSQGVCSWNLMPYMVNDCATLPSSSQSQDALSNKISRWYRLANRTNVENIKRAIDLGYPIPIVCAVNQSFYNMWKTTGIWSSNTGNVLGYHATCIVGYDDAKQMFKVQNSWGLGGDPKNKGFYWITYSMVQSGCLQEVYVALVYSIKGASSFCTSTTYSIDDVAPNSTITWVCSTNLSLTSSNSNTATFTAISNGEGWVQAIINNIPTAKKKVWIGFPSKPLDIIGFSFNGKHFGSNSYYDFNVSASLNQGTNLYEWVVGGGTVEEGQGTSQITALTCDAGDMDKYFDVSVRVGNACGWSPWLWRTGYVDGGVGPAYVVSPNPANSVITISIIENQRSTYEKAQSNPIKSIRVFDKMGLPIMLQTYSGKDNRVILNVSSLSKGIYFIKINEKESHTIIKE